MTVRAYSPTDERAVIELWHRCSLLRPWNNPKDDIARKLKVQPELFLVGSVGSQIVAAVIGGYDGHRGWVHYLAVDPTCQRRGLGQQLMEAAEGKLMDMGCPKINLQVRADNAEVIGFYETIGYETEDRVSMGKRLVEDQPE
jgi:ribosomal protein S18 acetylase RimI-like enzyme